MAAAKPGTSPGATSSPQLPSRPTTSGSDAASLATTGVPAAIASAAGSENPS